MPPSGLRARADVLGWALYDLAFDRSLRGLRRLVTRAALRPGTFPVLDVACGSGLQLRDLGPGAGGLLVGLDLSAGALARAAGRASAVVRADARRLPFRDGAFGTTLLSFALHGLDAPDRPAVLAECARVLSPGGEAIVLDFERPWSRRARLGRALAACVDLAGGLRHVRNARDFLRRGGARRLLADAGWSERFRLLAPGSSTAVVRAAPRRPAAG